MGRNLEFQVQDSFSEYIFFWRLGDLKNESHLLKKSHLYTLNHFFMWSHMIPGKFIKWKVQCRVQS